MNFDEGRRLVLDLLHTQGRAKNSEILAVLGGDSQMLEQVREDLIFNDLAEDKKGVGLILMGPVDSAAPTSHATAGSLSKADAVVTKAASIPLRPAPAINIFISYRRDDTQWQTDMLYKELVAVFGKEHVFRDIDSIGLGHNWLRELTSQLERSHVLLAVVGDKWLHVADERGVRRLEKPDDAVRVEVEMALAQKLVVLPVLVSPANMPKANQLPLNLRDFAFQNGTLLRPGQDFEVDLGRLLSALTRHGEALAAAKVSATSATGSHAPASPARPAGLPLSANMEESGPPAPPEAALAANISRLYADRASDCITRGEYKAALVECGKAIAADPDCFQAYLCRGGAHRLLNELPKALADYTEAIRLRPNSMNLSGVYCFRGEINATMGNFPAAIADFTEALRIDPQNTEPYFCRGIIQAAGRRYQGAIEDFTEVIQRNPQHGDALAHRGRCFAFCANYEPAIQDLSRALELYPGVGDLWFNRGTIGRLAGKNSEALADLDRAVEIAPDLAKAYDMRAEVRALGNNDLAIRDKQRADQLRQSGRFRDPQCGRGIAPSSLRSGADLLAEAKDRLRRGDLAAAERCAIEAMQIEPCHAEVNFVRGMIYAGRRNHSAAIVQFTRVLLLSPRYFEAYQWRAAARHTVGDFEGAVEDANHMLAMEPRSALGYRLRAMGYRGLGNAGLADRDDLMAQQLSVKSTAS